MSLDSVDDPGDVVADQGGGDFIEEGQDGKHIVIGVEHFAPDSSAATMNTYLRLGTPLAATQRSRASGDDLAAFVQGFNDDTRNRGDATSTPRAPTQSFDPSSAAIFNKALGTDPTTLDPRRVESAILQEKGGWRDHTDGNRITTTRGDKVEVIQGNYKLLVMGRQVDDGVTSQTPDALTALLNNSAGFDISGGQNDLSGDLNFASLPDPLTTATPVPSRDQTTLAVSYEWAPSSDGKTFCWTQTTNAGSASPKATDQGDYRIVNYNYVDYQEDNWGTADGRVSNIVSSTYANGLKTKYDVTERNLTVTSGPHSLWSPGEGSTIENGTGTIWELTHNKMWMMSEVDVSPLIMSVAASPVIANAFVGGVATAAVPMVNDLHAITHVDGHLLSHIDTHGALHTETHVGIHLDVHLNTHTDVHVGPHAPSATAQGEEISLKDKCWKVNMTTGEVHTETPAGKCTVSTTPSTQINAAGKTTLAPVTKQ